ncbi:MAG: YciI family protein [Gemmatimonadales bacterium]
MTIYKPGRDDDGPPKPEAMAQMGAFIGELAQSGVLLFTDGLQPSSKGARVRVVNGNFEVTDGPFAETKELVGGFAIVKTKTKEEAIELTKRFLSIMGEGESEIRLMGDEPGFDANASAPLAGASSKP